MDAGAMCMAGSVEKVQRMVQDAVSRGAKVLVGGSPGPAGQATTTDSTNGRLEADRGAAAAAALTGCSNGQFYPPTVLVGVDNSMAIYREEVFGPVSCFS